MKSALRYAVLFVTFRGYVGKPVAITEFGCCTYAGASAVGGTGWLILDQVSPTPQVTGVHQRDEAEQVGYFHELMEVFDAEDVDSAFWFGFAGFALPHGNCAAPDVDMASYGAVTVSD